MLRKIRSGFTLIELLIVVAIIAILAAIAVPNFLEAQTRAKVAREKNDLRSITVALEAYMVDWNEYMPWRDTSGNALHPCSARYVRMTTPVAYMTSVPKDPYSDKIETRGSSPGVPRWDTYDYVRSDVQANGPTTTRGPIAIYGVSMASARTM
jgi:type II secretion system protein G